MEQPTADGSFSFRPIAHIRTPFRQKFGTPRQGRRVPAARGEVVFSNQELAPLWLRGLEGFSHIWLIGVFHDNDAGAPPVVRPPRLAGRAVGALASRSPHRPNPISLTLVSVHHCDGSHLVVSGVDLIDGSPILDIKPFVPEADSAEAARAGWVEMNPWPDLVVRFSPKVEKDLAPMIEATGLPLSAHDFMTLITQTLKMDPRAVADRQRNLRRGQPRRFWLRLYDVDVGFSFHPNEVNSQVAEHPISEVVVIEEIRPAHAYPLNSPKA